MKNPESAESKEKSNFSMNFHANMKNKNRKKNVFCFSFLLARSPPLKKIFPFLRGGGGLHILSFEKSKNVTWGTDTLRNFYESC